MTRDKRNSIQSVHKNIIFIFKLHTCFRNGVYFKCSSATPSTVCGQTGQGSAFSGFTVPFYTIISGFDFYLL